MSDKKQAFENAGVIRLPVTLASVTANRFDRSERRAWRRRRTQRGKRIVTQVEA